jgi:hypothetical protein
MRRRIPIEKLLTWAYRDELPKQTVSALTGWERMIYLGTSVDEAPLHPKLPAVLGPPHPDALRIEWRVREMDPVVAVNWSWVRHHLMPDLAHYIDGDDTTVLTVARMITRRRATVELYRAEQVAYRTSPRALVEMHARLGNSPTWDTGPVKLVRVQADNGKAKVLGPGGSIRARDPGGRLVDGAYCPVELDPRPEAIGEARWEYVVWHTALVQLAHELKTDLTDHEPLPPGAPQRPWVTWSEGGGPTHRAARMPAQRPPAANPGHTP